MDLYHSWIYIRILNTRWFVWTLVDIVLAGNILCPFLLWFIFRGKKVFGKGGVVNGIFYKKSKQIKASNS